MLGFLIRNTCLYSRFYGNFLGELNSKIMGTLIFIVQWKLDLKKPDLRKNLNLGKNLDLRKIVATIDFLVHKLFDLKNIF